jgi:hypothetical protein
MAELKTKQTDENPLSFIARVENEQRRSDALALLDVFAETTGYEAKMWGGSIIGYGQYHYKSERSAQEGDWPLTGFSPRKSNLTLYIMPGFDSYQDELAKLGKHKTSVSCIYINKLSDIDSEVLKRIIKDSVAEMKRRYDTK